MLTKQQDEILAGLCGLLGLWPEACTASERERGTLGGEVEGLPAPTRSSPWANHGITGNSEGGTSSSAPSVVAHRVFEASEISRVDVRGVWPMRVSLPSPW